MARPLEAARAADPDPFRDRVRAALLEADEAVREMLLRKLAADPKAAELPPGQRRAAGGEPEGRRDRGGAAPGRGGPAPGRRLGQPHARADRLGELRPAPREEQVRYYTAARAVRPETAHELAHLLDAWAGPTRRWRSSPTSSPAAPPTPGTWPATAGASRTRPGRGGRGARAGRGRRPRGDPAEAGRRPGPLQPRQRPAGPGEAGGGDRRVPQGDPAEARLAEAHSNLGIALATRGRSRRRSPSTARPSG